MKAGGVGIGVRRSLFPFFCFLPSMRQICFLSLFREKVVSLLSLFCRRPRLELGRQEGNDKQLSRLLILFLRFSFEIRKKKSRSSSNWEKFHLLPPLPFAIFFCPFQSCSLRASFCVHERCPVQIYRLRKWEPTHVSFDQKFGHVTVISLGGLSGIWPSSLRPPLAPLLAEQLRPKVRTMQCMCGTRLRWS